MRGELGGVAVKEMTHVLKPHESQAVSGARTRVLELWKVVASPTATKNYLTVAPRLYHTGVILRDEGQSHK